jgi:hypothetical protein
MSSWSLYTRKRDGRSLCRALPALAALAAILTASVGVAAGATKTIERDVGMSSGAVADLAGALVGTGLSAALAGPLSDMLGLPISMTDALPGPGWAAAALLLPVTGLAPELCWAAARRCARAPTSPPTRTAETPNS